MGRRRRPRHLTEQVYGLVRGWQIAARQWARVTPSFLHRATHYRSPVGALDLYVVRLDGPRGTTYHDVISPPVLPQA